MLVFVLFSQLAGVYLWLEQKKQIVKSEVKTLLANNSESERKVLLKFSKEEVNTLLRWEHSREFEYNSQMYDVIQMQSSGDSVYYWCWWDKEETELNCKLKKLAEQDESKESREQKKQVRFVSFVFTPFFEEIQISPKLYTEFLNSLQCGYFNFYTSFYFKPLVPPPKIC